MPETSNLAQIIAERAAPPKWNTRERFTPTTSRGTESIPAHRALTPVLEKYSAVGGNPSADQAAWWLIEHAANLPAAANDTYGHGKPVTFNRNAVHTTLTSFIATDPTVIDMGIWIQKRDEDGENTNGRGYRLSDDTYDGHPCRTVGCLAGTITINVLGIDAVDRMWEADAPFGVIAAAIAKDTLGLNTDGLFSRGQWPQMMFRKFYDNVSAVEHELEIDSAEATGVMDRECIIDLLALLGTGRLYLPRHGTDRLVIGPRFVETVEDGAEG